MVVRGAYLQQYLIGMHVLRAAAAERIEISLCVYKLYLAAPVKSPVGNIKNIFLLNECMQ